LVQRLNIGLEQIKLIIILMLLKNSSIDRVRLGPFNSVVLLGNLIFIIQKLGYERYFLAVFIQLKPINIDLDLLLEFRGHLGPSS